jgi:hypothetical protein
MKRRPLPNRATVFSDEVLARAANLLIGRAALETAKRLYPRDLIELIGVSRGDHAMKNSSSPIRRSISTACGGTDPYDPPIGAINSVSTKRSHLACTYSLSGCICWIRIVWILPVLLTPDRGQKRLALIVALLVPVPFVAIIPVGQIQLPQVDSYIPVVDTVMWINDSIAGRH